jgi:hypothetical protein
MLTAVVVPASAAPYNGGNACSDIRLNWRKWHGATVGQYVLKTWYSSSQPQGCYVLYRKDGKRINAVITYTHDYVPRGKKTTKNDRQFINRKRVTQRLNTNNQSLTIRVERGLSKPPNKTFPVLYQHTVTFPVG